MRNAWLALGTTPLYEFASLEAYCTFACAEAASEFTMSMPEMSVCAGTQRGTLHHMSTRQPLVLSCVARPGDFLLACGLGRRQARPVTLRGCRLLPHSAPIHLPM